VRKMATVFIVLVLVLNGFATMVHADSSSAPENLNGIMTVNSAQLSWSAAENATAYNLYRAQSSSGPYEKVNDASIATASYTDKGLATDKTYYYKVSALRESGESSLSTEFAGTTVVALGPNVKVYDPSMDISTIQSEVDDIFAEQERAEFGQSRYSLLFKPGVYNNLNVRVGFYTQVAGLGQDPDDVLINGGVTADAKWDNGNATRNFWRSVENLSFKPLDLTKNPPTLTDAKWAVSQAAPMRRVHVLGKINLFDFTSSWDAGWASGGYIADSIIDGTILPASQQQFFSRNNEYTSWLNGVWNMMFVGDTNPPEGTFPAQPYTVIDETPAIKEKPYLYIDDSGEYNVFVPSLQTDKVGVSWKDGSTPGDSLPISDFYIADPESSTADDINAALENGLHLLFTPGFYYLDETIRVENPDTVVMGLGYASLVPTTGLPAMTVADVDGVSVSSLFFIAGEEMSPSLLTVGEENSDVNHSANPILIADLFFGIGGFLPGSADVGLIVNSDDVIGDHFWIWRADHGAGASWDTNISNNGIIVNGEDVTIYGLFNEHHEQYQTIWNGNGGRLYFYQSEIPYDPPSQEAWMSHDGTVNGYASYKVGDDATTHEAWGLGIYSFFRDADVDLENAMEVPQAEGVKIHHVTTIWLNGVAGSEITHIINGTGGKVYANSPASAMRQTVTHYTTGDSEAPTEPTDLAALAVSSKQIDLTWTAATDNIGVESYDIYRDGVKVGTENGTSYSDSGLKAKKEYSYTVVARDSAGNQSEASNEASAVTQRELTTYNQSGWTATASSGTGSVGNLIDGNKSSRWSSGTPMVPGQYFAIDMKSAKQISRLSITLPAGNNDYARGYEIYISQDGIDWGTAVASGAGSASIIVDFEQALTAQFVKVVQTGSAGSWWAVDEFGVYTDTEKSLDRKTWTATSSPAGDSTANLLDDKPSTRWSSGTTMVPGQSIVIDMKAEQWFNKIVVDSNGSSNDYSRSYEIYISDDGAEWGTALVAGTANGPLIVSDFADQTARYLKLVQTATNSSWWSIHEIMVYRDGTVPVPVSGLEVAGAGGAEAITAKGGTLQMTAQALPVYADDTDVVWSVTGTDDEETELATISARGLVTALDNGAVKVVATAVDGSGVTGSAIIEISGQHPVTAIIVTAEDDATSITTAGGELQLFAAVSPDNADDPGVIWSVTDSNGELTSAATINDNGVLTALDNGTVKAVATAIDGSGVTGNLTIAISGQHPVTDIEVTGAGGASTITTKGGTLQLNAEVLPADADNDAVVWSVAAPDDTPTDKATISVDGLLTAVKNGDIKAVATAADGSGVKGTLLIVISGQKTQNTSNPPVDQPTVPEQSGEDTELVLQGEEAVAKLSPGETEAQLSVDSIKAAGNHPVVIQSDEVSITIPNAVLTQLIGLLPGAIDAKVTVRVHGAAQAATPAGPNLTFGGQVFDLDLFLTDKDGKKVKLSSFREPVVITLPITSNNVDKELLGVYYYNEATKVWEYVGGTVDPSGTAVVVSLQHFSKYAVMAYNKSFTDVPISHWAYKTIKVLASKHIANGVTDESFNPAGQTSRAQFVTMLANALGLASDNGVTPFTDVDAQDWYAGSIAAAYKAGLVTGVSETSFAPNATITREQMAILMVRAYELASGKKASEQANLASLKDGEKVSVWAADGVAKAIELGLMKGQSAALFAPQDQASRAETAQAIYNLLSKLQRI
jgi:fibronectin type 3 domain-containing protein